MSLLVIQLPARDRLGVRGGAGAGGGDAAPRLPAELDYAFSADGRSLTRAGRAAPALLPRADSTVAVLAAADLAWHRVDIPKAPPARLRAALAGVMEERLLDDEDALHFALGAGARGGESGWVAVLRKPWLQGLLAALEGAGLGIDRVLPAAQPVAPGEAWQGHFHLPDDAAWVDAPGPDVPDVPDAPDAPDAADTVALSGPATVAPHAAAADDLPLLLLSRPDGVLSLRLGGGLARALLPPAGTPVRWTATPAAAAAAERWLGAPVALLGQAEHLLQAGAAAGNLRQFDLAARTRGTRALRDAARRLLSPEWRPVRWGLGALLVVGLGGLNAHAWQQDRALAAQRAAMDQLLRDTHPGVRAVLDAPLQMQRETERLRAAAGRPGEGDLELMLAAAASAWPEAQGPVASLRFEPGRLVLAAPGWGEAELAAFGQRLAPLGLAAEMSEGRVTLSRAAAATTRGAAP